jgi:hypothetical protein
VFGLSHGSTVWECLSRLLYLSHITHHLMQAAGRRRQLEGSIKDKARTLADLKAEANVSPSESVCMSCH